MSILEFLRARWPRNLDLAPAHELAPFRKLALGTWRAAGDPSVYGSLVVPVDEALAYIADVRRATRCHLTLTHLVGKVVADILAAYPDANALLRRGTIARRRDIGVFFQVATRDARTGDFDLSGATIHAPHTKSLVEICEELERRFAAVRADRDPDLAGTRHLLARLPQPLVGLALRWSAFASYTLNLDLRWVGIPRDAFGSVMITNIGSLGLDEAYVPLVPYSRVPLLLALGRVHERPVARAGRVATENAMKICATFDHRVLDGAHLAQMATRLRDALENPRAYFGAVPGRSRAEAVR